MKLTIKQLQGGECTVEVLPNTFIFEIKRQVAHQLNIPIKEQKLLFLGRTLIDELVVKAYPAIKDGSKLNLIVKKPEGLYDIAFNSFKRAGMSDFEANTTAKRFLTTIQENINKLSWDDIERLCFDCLELKNKSKTTSISNPGKL